ncbi:DUF3152 domain-containing protein [Streptomyces sp. NPDC057837]|uniref:DUF3152 domain-containing protein n=1 Tax=Streptomyces sp. NPDC057837 TaxID=3346260 RepID=UPI00369051A3
MTADHSPPAPRRRRATPSHASPRRGRKGPLSAGAAALVLLAGVGAAAAGWTSHEVNETRATPRTPSAPQGHGSPPSGRPAGSSPRPHATGPAASGIPATGPGTFTVAPGESAEAGTGKTLLYRVEVEDGLDLSAADVARQVDGILADRRGWTADGRSAFRRVSAGRTDFVVKVATPGTVDRICGQYGLDTGGEVNCNVAQNVMVNLKRWLLATPVYADDVTAYRALIINHEVGHFLGHGHVGCAGTGEPAPVMMQQIKGMHGCVPNVWPYDGQGRYVSGPALEGNAGH